MIVAGSVEPKLRCPPSCFFDHLHLPILVISLLATFVDLRSDVIWLCFCSPVENAAQAEIIPRALA